MKIYSPINLLFTLTQHRTLSNLLGLGIILLLAGCNHVLQPIINAAQLPVQSQEVTPSLSLNSTSPAPSQATIPEETGNLRDLIVLLQEGMPGASSGGYHTPTSDEQKVFAQLVSMLDAGQTNGSEEIANQNHYDLVHFSDPGSPEITSYLLFEAKPIQKGWGIYALSDQSSNGIIIEAPHPLFDEYTPSVAVDIYRGLHAEALLIAGAHRDADPNGSADVAHTPTSIFQTVHLALLNNLSNRKISPVVIQIHGYSTVKHDDYPLVIIGIGSKPDPADTSLANKIAAALKDQGVSASVCNGTNWLDLCGTKNVQASVMKEGTFIHLEMDQQMREDDSAIIAALKSVFLN